MFRLTSLPSPGLLHNVKIEHQVARLMPQLSEPA